MSDSWRPDLTTGEVDVRGSSDRAAMPASPEGYAIDLRQGTLHRRYARHAVGLPRVRTEAQVRTYLGYRFSVCEACWPPAPAAPPEKSRPARKKTRIVSEPAVGAFQADAFQGDAFQTDDVEAEAEGVADATPEELES